MQIQDGKGTGKRAAVNSENRLETQTVNVSTLAHSATLGKAFGAGTPHYTKNSTNACVAIVKNTSSDQNLHLVKMFANWNGGDTNHNRGCLFTLNIGMTYAEPPTNGVQTAMKNLNLGSGNEADADVFVWNGAVGDGMVLTTNGTSMFYGIVGQGNNEIDVGGAIIMGPGDAMALFIAPEETGKFSLSMMGYFADQE